MTLRKSVTYLLNIKKKELKMENTQFKYLINLREILGNFFFVVVDAFLKFNSFFFLSLLY